MREKALVIGLGEVGLSIYEIVEESGQYSVYGIDLNEDIMRDLNQGKIPKRVDIIHICILCSNAKKFISVVSKYAKKYKPHLLIVNSTVPPRTTKQLSKKCSCGLVYSPIFGTHKGKDYMKWEIRRWTKLIGGVDNDSVEAAREHFMKIGIKTYIVRSPIEAEIVKIFETTYYGWMITFYQEFHRIACNFGADFDEVVRCIEEMHEKRLDKPIWYPDVIGGHCVMQNIDLLLSCYDGEFLRLIKKSNELRKVESRNATIRMEIRKIKKRCLEFWKKCHEKRR